MDKPSQAEHDQLQEARGVILRASWTPSLKPHEQKRLADVAEMLDEITTRRKPEAPPTETVSEDEPEGGWADAPDFLTVDEAAELLRRHVSTVYRRLERGHWPFAWKDGNDWRIEKDALREHLKSASIPTRKAASDPMIQTKRVRFDREMDEALRRVG